MKNILQSLTYLIQAEAISGYEWEGTITKTIQSLIGSSGTVIADNLIYKIGKGKKKIFISAHMDEIGFIVTNITKDYVTILPIGDVSIQDIAGQCLVFGKELSKPIKKYKSFEDLKVFGLQNIVVGSVGTFEKKVTSKDSIFTSPSIDNKAGCLALIETFKRLKKETFNKTIYFCFSAREEVGLNGLLPAVRKINPDICIDIDCAYAQSPNHKKKSWRLPILGNGPAIQLMGTNFVIQSKYRRLVENIAQKASLLYQYEIPEYGTGGTNSSSLVNNGYETIQINIPVAGQHSAQSKVNIKDIENTIQLLTKIIQVI